ncbi:MAG: MBOAT family O-acyltransferase [Lacipirellulaceae bacterium]
MPEPQREVALLFNSYVFVLLFLPVVLALWWLPPIGSRARLGILVAASCLFYGTWDWRFLGLLIGSTVFDYEVGRRLFAAESQAAKRVWLIASVAMNLSVLAVFKYAGFAATSYNAITEWLATGGQVPVPEIVLPVGISFYTFQTMSYAIDLYRGQARPAPSLLHFAAYVSMFPQLVAGPIVRYADVDDQFRGLQRRVDWGVFASGVWFFVAGMSQKVLLADSIAARIDPLLANPDELGLATAWFAILGYSMQLYFDFAGYSNMAVGLGRMLGFEFCQNFDSPYQASSVQGFWRRWHMSLSQMLRDYLFVPLGGSRGGLVLTARNLMLVMLIGGLWHGAGWTFVLWGGYHGLLLVTNVLWQKLVGRALPTGVGRALTFFAVVLGWVLFRMTTVADATTVYAALAGMRGIEVDPLAAVGGVTAAGLLVVLLAITQFVPNIWRFRLPLGTLTGVLAALLLLVCVLRFDAASPFLYFQF